MEVNSVSSVQNQNFTSKAEQDVKTEKTPEEIKGGKKKLALALAGMAVTAAATVYLVKSGKGKLALDKIKNLEYKNSFKGLFKKTNLDTIPYTIDSKGSLHGAFESIEEFKKAGGSFSKGNATVAGKPFTGCIATKNARLDYTDGKIQESIFKKTKNGLFAKFYNYNQDGALDKVTGAFSNKEALKFNAIWELNK